MGMLAPGNWRESRSGAPQRRGSRGVATDLLLGLALSSLGGLGCGHALGDRPGQSGAAAGADVRQRHGGTSVTGGSEAKSSRRLARGDGSPLDAELARGDAAFADGDYRTARLAYQAALAQHAGDPAATVGIVRATLGEAEVPEGVNAAPGDPTLVAMADRLGALLLAAPEYEPAQLELGRIFLVLGEVARAKEPVLAAVRLEPNDPEAQSTLGIVSLLTGEREAAVVALKRASVLEPGDAQRFTNLATAELQAGLLADAIASYRKAAKLAPDDGSVRTSLGTALLQAGDVTEALPELEAAVRLDPTRAAAHNNLGFARQREGTLELAIAAYRTALALDATLGSAWINLGTALAKQGALGEARTAVTRALALDPEDPRAREVMGELDQLERTPK